MSIFVGIFVVYIEKARCYCCCQAVNYSHHPGNDRAVLLIPIVPHPQWVIDRLTRRWIPLVEKRVASLPNAMHLSDYGAKRLMELPNLVISGGVQTANQMQQPSMPVIPCLELPGESGLLHSNTGVLSHPSSTSSSPHTATPPATNPSTNMPLQLVISEILPHVTRVRCAAGHCAPPARRIGVRGSNGRVYYYDLACPGVSLEGVGASLAAAGARSHTLVRAQGRAAVNVAHVTADGLSTPVYNGLRHGGPVHLFQMVNDILASQPETARRRLSLFVPRCVNVNYDICSVQTEKKVVYLIHLDLTHMVVLTLLIETCTRHLI